MIRKSLALAGFLVLLLAPHLVTFFWVQPLPAFQTTVHLLGTGGYVTSCVLNTVTGSISGCNVGASIAPCSVSGSTMDCPGGFAAQGSGPGVMQLFDSGGVNYVGYTAPSSVSANYYTQEPGSPPNNGAGLGQVRTCPTPSGGISVCTWVTTGTGTVTNTSGSLTAGVPIIGNGGNDVTLGNAPQKIFTDGSSATILCGNAGDVGCTQATAGQTAFAGPFASLTIPAASFTANRMMRITPCFNVTSPAAAATINISLFLGGAKVQTTSAQAPSNNLTNSHFCAQFLTQGAAAQSSTEAVWTNMLVSGPAGWTALGSAGLTAQPVNVNTAGTTVSVQIEGVYGGTLNTGNFLALEQLLIEGPF